MIQYFILLLCLCLVVIDTSPVAAPDTREVPDLQLACARMDMWGLSEAAKALCGAVVTCIKSQGRPVCNCYRCTPGTGGRIGCVLSGKKGDQQRSKRKQRLTLEKVFFFYPQQYFLPEFEINSSTSQTSLLGKMMYLADRCPKKNSDEFTESILWVYLFCDRIISSAKRVHVHMLNHLFFCLRSKSSTFFSLLPMNTAKAH